MMQDSPSALAGILNRCQTGLTAIFRDASGLPHWTDGLAALLGELLPQASLTACLLRGEGTTCLAVRPEGGHSDSSRNPLLSSQLSSLDPVAIGVQKLPPRILPGLQLLATAIHENARPRGFLIAGFPLKTSSEGIERAEVVLTVAAPGVAVRWRLESLQREQAEMARFALVGQAFAGLGHELNNALNSMMLQTSVVQLRVDAQIRQDLAAIRQHGAQAAALVRSLQHVVQERREKSYPVDLGTVLAEVLEEAAELRGRLSLQPAGSSLPPAGETPVLAGPRIYGTRSAVKQFLHLVLEGVCAGTKAPIQVATGDEDGGTSLRLTVVDATAEDSPSLLDVLLWQNLDEVCRQAGQSLLRQLGGTLTAERASDGTFLLRIDWPPSA